MTGSKKLSAIRQELQHALTATGEDPIRWLEERMTAPVSGDSDILQSLRRLLEPTSKEKRRPRRIGTRK
jgi:hypothetical protein